MFLRWILRQLSIITKEERREVYYKCKVCDAYVTVHLTDQEWIDLENGIPFNSVFHGPRRQVLLHFKKGLCSKHSEEQL